MGGHIDAKTFDWQGATVTQAGLIPGDPYEVARLGKQLRDVADEINKQAANLRNLVDGQGWDSDSGRAFASKVGDTAGLLQKSYGRYDEAAKALGTNVRPSGPTDEISWSSGTEWASTLELAQVKARDALNRGKTADATSQSTQKQIAAATHANQGQPDTSPAGTKLTDQKNSSDGDLQKAGTDLNHAIDIKDTEGKAVSGQINDFINSDGLKNPTHHWWDVNWKNLVADVGHIAGAIAAIAGIAALCLAWVPILGEVLAAIALVAGAVALVCDSISAVDGKGNWFDVAIDVIGLLSCGAGRGLGAMAEAARGVKFFEVAMDAGADSGKVLKYLGMTEKGVSEIQNTRFMGLFRVGAKGFAEGLSKGPFVGFAKGLSEFKDGDSFIKAMSELHNGEGIIKGFREYGQGLGSLGPALGDAHWGLQAAGWFNSTGPLLAGWANMSIPDDFQPWEPGVMGMNWFKHHHILWADKWG